MILAKRLANRNDRTQLLYFTDLGRRGNEEARGNQFNTIILVFNS